MLWVFSLEKGRIADEKLILLKGEILAYMDILPAQLTQLQEKKKSIILPSALMQTR